MSSKDLTDARRAKKDEFFTQLEDIHAEMTTYLDYNQDVFRDRLSFFPVMIQNGLTLRSIS